jgi:hypothetical protein
MDGISTPLRIFTWHIHGSYLYYLTQGSHEYYLPVKPGRPEGYGGKGGSFRWGNNVHEIPAEGVRDLDVDCILFQSIRNYHIDQYDILTEEQRQGPKIYLEHDPPRVHPTDTQHPIDDPQVILVHVTHFNRLMWDNRRTLTRIVRHGVCVPDDVHYTGEKPRGLVIVNNMHQRGRRLGLDIFEEVRKVIPLDLVGMGSEELGGIGAYSLDRLFKMEGQYRFFFNPIRYTSLGLAVCEAMMIGLPVVGLSTTEMGVVIKNGVSGYVDTDIYYLIDRMAELIENPVLAARLGRGAKIYAQENFHIKRFLEDWDRVYFDARQMQNQTRRAEITGSR